MAFVHPFHRSSRRTRSAEPTSIRSTVVPPHSATSTHTSTTTHRPVEIPRALVLDDTGKPRRDVLLAAIMIRRGRSIDDIVSATGLPDQVVHSLAPAG